MSGFGYGKLFLAARLVKRGTIVGIWTSAEERAPVFQIDAAPRWPLITRRGEGAR